MLSRVGPLGSLRESIDRVPTAAAASSATATRSCVSFFFDRGGDATFAGPFRGDGVRIGATPNMEDGGGVASS
jgi:hypothetical protein